jgi:hypothetical protein
MDSTVFRCKYVEKELFAFNSEPELPLTSWYHPARDYASEAMTTTPQLMNADEDPLMAQPPPRRGGTGLRGRTEGDRRWQPGQFRMMSCGLFNQRSCEPWDVKTLLLENPNSSEGN